MQDNYAKVEKISQEGYQLEFGTVLEDAFKNYKKIAGIGGISVLLVGMVVAIIFIGIIGAIYGFSNFAGTMTGLNPDIMSGSSLLIFFGISVFISALLSPINAGFLKMAYLARHDHPFGVGTIFEYFKGSYFRELFLATIFIGFASSAIVFLFEATGMGFAANLISYVISFFTFLTVPLIIFSNLTAAQAIPMSVKLVLKEPLILLGLLIVAVVFACLGLIAFCIGIFFTVPFIFSMYYTIYAAIFPSEESALDEIGQNQD